MRKFSPIQPYCFNVFSQNQHFITLSALSGLNQNIMCTVCNKKLGSFDKDSLENKYTDP